MAQGLQVFDENGALRLDVSSSPGRVLGYAQVGAGSTGSVSNDGLLLGTPFYIIVPENIGAYYWYVVPDVSFSGNTISWNWPWAGDASAPQVPVTIIYGIY